MQKLPNASAAERNQARKRAYLPPVWPLVVGLAVIVIIYLVVR